jgi:hypothetical protein
MDQSMTDIRAYADLRCAHCGSDFPTHEPECSPPGQYEEYEIYGRHYLVDGKEVTREDWEEVCARLQYEATE